jgi:hypothetical protein
MKRIFVCNLVKGKIFSSKEELLKAVKKLNPEEVGQIDLHQIDLHPTEKVVWGYCDISWHDYVSVEKIDPPKIISTITEI